MVHAEQPENRTAYAFWPTNEYSIEAFLVERNDQRFFNRDIIGKPSQLFAHPDAINALVDLYLIV